MAQDSDGVCLFFPVDAVIWILRMFLLQALHVMVMLRFKATIKEIILIASLCVNKMAFLERGCGELRSRCLVIIHSKYGQGCSGEETHLATIYQPFV